MTDHTLPMIMLALRYIAAAIERRPSLGYAGTLASISGGFIGLVETATKIGGLISVLIGIAVGLYTLRIQKRNLERVNAEDEKNSSR